LRATPGESRTRGGSNHGQVSRGKGKYVLIKGREVIGIYANEQDALREAVSRFGYEPALIKQIAVKESLITMGGIVY
jgi:hypothetical protein